MSRDEFGHLEHADLTLAVEHRPERVIGVDLRSLGLVLKAVLFDIVPKLFCQLGTRQRLRSDNGSEFVIGLDGSHEGWVRLTF